MSESRKKVDLLGNRRSFIGGSDARIIMGDDEAGLLRLWREVDPQDLSGNLRFSWSCNRRPKPGGVLAVRRERRAPSPLWG